MDNCRRSNLGREHCHERCYGFDSATRKYSFATSNTSIQRMNVAPCHSALTVYGIECLYNLEERRIALHETSIKVVSKAVGLRIWMGRLLGIKSMSRNHNGRIFGIITDRSLVIDDNWQWKSHTTIAKYCQTTKQFRYTLGYYRPELTLTGVTWPMSRNHVEVQRDTKGLSEHCS